LHLYKSLLKSKPISTSPAFPAYIAAKVSQLSEPSDTATANVTARLFNSNPVKAALADVLGNVHRELGIATGEVPCKKKRLRAVDYNDKPSSVIKSQKPAPYATSNATTREKLARESRSLLRSPRRSVSVEADDMSNSEGGSTDYDQYHSRLADSDSDDDAEAQGSDSWEGLNANSTPETQDSPLPTRAIIAPPPHYHPSHSLSPSPFPSPSLLPSPTPPPTVPRSTHPPKPPPTTKQTTFLPSLIGGYWSGSDSCSAPSDTEPSAAQPRKNRRGQQERRAIWEKKFGKGAKHLLQEQRVQKRDEGWDARRGASDGQGRGRGRSGMRGGGRSRQQPASGANGEVVSGKRSAGRGGEAKGKRKGDEGPLHPSWEAKKKAKEKAAAGAGAVAFLGKKTVFD